MTTVLAALAIGAAPYQPTGPVIEFVMSAGGTFEITTDPERSPKTVAHIVALVRKGFYDRQRFHRVEDWVIQWGAPESKTLPLNARNPETGQMETNSKIANGGSGKSVPFEESDVEFVRGIVGVASTGLQVGGDSQLFILKKDWPRLYRSYAVVGKVTAGMDVVGMQVRGDRIVRARIVTARR
jgi:cyclophilin family peptidyl-prolyl cis-trans isomerase